MTTVMGLIDGLRGIGKALRNIVEALEQLNGTLDDVHTEVRSARLELERMNKREEHKY